MDKRIMKTRKGLKNALLNLLEDHSFEEITVTEICEHAKTGRLTFYKYYSDKNELMKDCFQDLQDEVMSRMRKEGETIRVRQPQISEDSETDLPPRLNCFLCWMEAYTDVIIDVLGSQSFLTAKMIGNSGMMYELYQFIIKCLEKMERESEILDDLQEERFWTQYPIQQVNSFLAMGMWGYVFSRRDGTDMMKTRRDAKALIRDLLGSAIFINPNGNRRSAEEEFEA